ncbi:unnamed protein product [Linum trigynum]|uniref:Uncharacterized protein n=1 Tax=Linum trigynum TaxID=586398 RepID=A0AAV2E9T3_9ROSI
MEFTLLCNLGGPRNASVSLRLQLLHVWPAKSPGDIRIYNYYKLVCFAQGTLIHGVSPTSMASGIRRNLSVGKIYVIKSFALRNPPNQYRSCSFDLALGLSPSTSFQPCVLPAESFLVDAYEFVAFSQLNMRAGNHCYLTDVIGRFYSISGISHKITNNGPAVKQTITIEDESGVKVSITLWDEFSMVLDHVALSQADSIEAVILALGGLLVNKLGDDYVLSSSAATRIAINPPVPKAYYLASRFAEKHEVVESLPVDFATAVDATADADCRTKTLDQLLALSRTNSSREEKYRCGGVIVDVESSTPCQVVPLDDPTVVGDLLEYSSHPPLAAPVVCTSSSVGGPSGSSRAAKGKEKVSDSLLVEAPAMPFNITDEPDLIDRFPSSEAKDLRNPISANVGSEDIDTGSRILGGSQLSVMGVQVGSTRAAATVPMSSAVHSCAPSVQSATSMIPKRSSRIDESMSPEDVGRDSSMPAAKILKPSPESSLGKTLGSTVGSPSASLLVSPLAKIKVEKLDAADIAQVPHGGSSQAGVNIERDSSVDSQKNSAAKRALFKNNASKNKKSSISDFNTSITAKDIVLSDYEAIGRQRNNPTHILSGTGGALYGG